MQPPHWDKVETLFARLIELPFEQRAEFLERTCDGDEELIRELESLLEAHGVTHGVLDAAPRIRPADDSKVDDSSSVGTHVGPYRLIRPLGEGGMGSVWLAERADGVLKRTVALKRPHVTWLAGFAERMSQERDILAALEHPNIARLYDAGVTSDGLPYLALQYVAGEPLTRYCDSRRLSVRGRLELFLQVLDAVRYAHAHLVIHRDIKPSNILVSADGQVHLLDFGIAKLLSPRATDEPLTQLGARLATLSYASPEHIAGRSVTTTSDVYSLGVLLAELLCGARPYELKRATPAAVEEAILRGEPVLPSRNVQPAAPEARGVALSTLVRQLRGDLDNIVSHALRKDPDERYATVELLAQDISRHLRGEAILAQRGSAWYHAGKFLGRHKLAAGLIACAFLSLIGGLGTALWQSHRAETEARTSRAVERFLEDVFLANTRAQPDPVKARETTARQLLAQGISKIDTAMADAPEAKLRTLGTFAELQHQLALDEEAVALNRKRLALARQLYGPHDPRVVEVLIALSTALMATQENEQRAGVLKEALDILDRNGDRDSPLRGNLLGEFSQWAFAQDIHKAMDYAQQSVTLLRRYPPSDDLAEALIMEGITRRQTGQPERAEQLLTEAEQIAKAVGGELSSKLARIYGYRSEARYSTGDWSGAQRDLEEGLRIGQRLGGAEDVQAAQVEQRLALLLLRTSRVKEAVTRAEHARDVVLKTSPADDPWFAPIALENAGFIRVEAGDLDGGIEDLARAEQSWRKYHGGTGDVISGYERYANALIQAGRLDEADRLLTETAAIRARTGDRLTNANGDILGRTSWLITAGRASEARPLMDKFSVTPATQGSVSVSLLQKTVQLAQIDLASGHPDAVFTDLQPLRNILERTPLRASLKTYEADANLLEGRAKLASGDTPGALSLIEASRRQLEDLYDKRTSLRIADAYIALAGCLVRAGDRAQARELATKAAVIHATHRALGDQYRKPLRALQREL